MFGLPGAMAVGNSLKVQQPHVGIILTAIGLQRGCGAKLTTLNMRDNSLGDQGVSTLLGALVLGAARLTCNWI